MCIEAALIGHNIALALIGNLFAKRGLVPAEVFEKVRKEADEAADYDVELDITGSDINGRMIEIARRNAEEIGLGDSITFKQQAVKDFKTEKSMVSLWFSLWRTLREEASVQRLYQEMGQVFRPLKTWSKYF